MEHAIGRLLVLEHVTIGLSRRMVFVYDGGTLDAGELPTNTARGVDRLRFVAGEDLEEAISAGLARRIRYSAIAQKTTSFIELTDGARRPLRY